MSPLASATISLPALRHLRANEADRADTLRHLASGVRVSRGEDGPADLIAGENLSVARVATGVNIDNAAAAIAAADIAERALGEVAGHLNRLERLVLASSDDATGLPERLANQVEIDRLLDRIDVVLHGSEFKGTSLFRGRPPSQALPDPVGIVGEIGRSDVTQPAPGVLQRINFAQEIPGAVVVPGPLTYNDTVFASVRIHSVDDFGFDFEIEELNPSGSGLLTASDTDGVHGLEQFGWIAAPAGVHTLADGTLLEMGEINVSSSNTDLFYSAPFTGNPVLVTGLVSENEPDRTTIQMTAVDPTRARLRLKDQESRAATGHVAERVAYAAVQSPLAGPGAAEGTGTLNEGGIAYDAARTPQNLDHNWRTHNFPGFADPVVIASFDTANGGDTFQMRTRNLTSGSVELLLQEERSQDAEIGHLQNRASVLAFARPGAIEPFQPPPPVSDDDLAGRLPDDPDTFLQSAFTFDLGDGKRHGKIALRFEDTTIGSLGDPSEPLATLATGGELAVGVERPTMEVAERAQRSIDQAREQINTVRNRAGRFRRWSVEPIRAGLHEQSIRLADAHSNTTDTDLAKATADLTRQGILDGALADVFAAIRTNQQATLALLG